MEEDAGAPPSLRESNRLRVVQALQILGVTSRADVARRTGLSRSTVSTIVSALQAEGLVVDRQADSRTAAGGGRPPALIALNPGAGLAIGIDFGKRHLAVALADLSHELLAEEWRDMSDDYDAETGIERAAELVERVLDAAGAGRAAGGLVYLKLATGIGAGIVIGGRLFEGAGGTAGEIGHTSLDETGDICRCGSRGCLETYASGTAIASLLSRSLAEDLTLDDVLARAIEGDPGCRRALADAGRHIGAAVADLCNLINPERIVVGGSMAVAGDVLLDPLREAVGLRAIPSAAEDVEIVLGELGGRAELLGAVALVLHEAGPAWSGPAPAVQQATATGGP